MRRVVMRIAAGVVVAVLVSVFVMWFDTCEKTALEARLAVVEAEIVAVKERGGGTEGTVSVKDLFSAASLEAQLKILRAEVEKMRGQQIPGKGGITPEVLAEVSQRQERVLREASRAFQHTWKEAFVSALQQQGFDEEQRRRIGDDYQRLLGEIEEIQVRWFRGEIDWNRSLDEIKMRSIEFYDTTERNFDTETARRVLDIAFPTPDMKRFFFSGSGQ